MGNRVASDHPSVETARGRLVRRGGTSRPTVEVSAEAVSPTAEVVRLVLDGRVAHAPVVSRSGTTSFLGAFDNARRARERDGADRLAEWVTAREVEYGRSVLVDVLGSGDGYGLRQPGETAVYAVDRGPDRSLRRIAEEFDS